MFTKNVVLAFIIGLVLGGLVIGLLDANRPEPLFSSAHEDVGGVKNDVANLGVSASEFDLCPVDVVRRYGSCDPAHGPGNCTRAGGVWDNKTDWCKRKGKIISLEPRP